MIKVLTVIIPVFNEDDTIYELLRIVHKIDLIKGVKKEIIVINDDSSDNSEKEINKFINDNKPNNLTYLKNNKNIGKGGSIKVALKHAVGEYCIIQDADLELNPNEINDLLLPVIANKADIVYGSRFINSKKKKKESILNRIANKFLTFFGNFCIGVKLTDLQTCYKLIPTEIFKKISLVENRFAFDPEITAKLARNKSLRWKEVSITYNPRTVEEGKKIRWRDGFRALYSIIKYGLLEK